MLKNIRKLDKRECNKKGKYSLSFSAFGIPAFFIDLES